MVTVLAWYEVGGCRNFPLSKSPFQAVDHLVETNTVCYTRPTENHNCFASFWLS